MPTTSLFTKLNQFILDSNASNSNNDKIEVIKAWQDHDEIMDLLWWVYNPFINFGVTSKHCKKRPDLTNNYWYGNILYLLYDLSEGNLTGHEAIAAVNNFANTLYPTERELFWRVIDRNLKTRATADTINKVIPGWIPEFNVALAKNYDDHKKKVELNKQAWFGSQKLDGCLHGETNIEFEDGSILKIQDVVENEIKGKVKSYNVVTREIEYKEITNWMKNGQDINEDNNDWYKLILENDKEIILTGNHRVWIPNLYCWRRVDELNGDEKLLID